MVTGVRLTDHPDFPLGPPLPSRLPANPLELMDSRPPALTLCQLWEAQGLTPGCKAMLTFLMHLLATFRALPALSVSKLVENSLMPVTSTPFPLPSTEQKQTQPRLRALEPTARFHTPHCRWRPDHPGLGPALPPSPAAHPLWGRVDALTAAQFCYEPKTAVKWKVCSKKKRFCCLRAFPSST